MRVLGIDACLGHCSVALLEDDIVRARRSEAMRRGHVERLAPMVAEVLEEARISPSRLDLIGVTRGPGGFTGARLGVAFARGLALASGCRAVGVTTLEALAAPHAPARVAVALDGRRNDLFVQLFEGGADKGEPLALLASDFEGFLARHRPGVVVGPDEPPPIEAADVARLARRWPAGASPRPLYLRAPDAKPPRRAALR